MATRQFREGVPRTFRQALGEVHVVTMKSDNVVEVKDHSPTSAVFGTHGAYARSELRAVLSSQPPDALSKQVLRSKLFGDLQHDAETIGNALRMFGKDGLQEIAARWLLHHFNHCSYDLVVSGGGQRSWVVCGDVGKEVVIVPGKHGADGTSNESQKSGRGIIVAMAPMATKQFWVDVRLTSSTDGDAAAADGSRSDDVDTVVRVDISEVRLASPEPLHFDHLIPCGEIEGHGWSKLLVSTFSKYTGGSLTASVDHATHLSQQAAAYRRTLASSSTAAATSRQNAHVTLIEKPDDRYELTFEKVTHAILGRHLRKLRSMYQGVGGASGSAASVPPPSSDELLPSGGSLDAEGFADAVFAVLCRYSAMFGPQDRNQGAHAAVPPVVVQALKAEFGVCFDCFGNPFNANTEYFCSLFPDTDRFFGSVGRFFDIKFRRGSFGCNPPYDSPTMKKTADHLLDCFRDIEEEARKTSASSSSSSGAEEAPLCFTIVIPKWDDDKPSEASALKAPRKAMEAKATNDLMTAAVESLTRSKYCVAQTVLEAAITPYLDGHQHLIECPYFTIRSDTRLIVLQNAASVRAYPNAVERLQRIQALWNSLAVSKSGREADE